MFQQLQQAFVAAPLLTRLDFSKDFMVETNASGTDIGAVLLQGEKTIACFGKKLPSHLYKASTYVWELHDVVEVVRKWQ